MTKSQSLIQVIYRKAIQIFQELFLENNQIFTASTLHFIYSNALFALLDKKPHLPPDLAQVWLQKLRDSQLPDGFFRFAENEEPFARLEATALAICQIRLSDQDLKYPIYAARRFEELTYAENWLIQQNNLLLEAEPTVEKAILSGKSVLCMAAILNKSYLDGLLDSTALAHFINSCDASANPETGLWIPAGKNWLLPGLVDAFFRIQVYNFWRRQVPYPRKMIQSALDLQQRSGHFIAAGSEFLLADLAAVSILATNYQQQDFYHFRIRRALKNAREAVYQKIRTNTGWNLEPLLSATSAQSLKDDTFLAHSYTQNLLTLNYLTAFESINSKILNDETALPAVGNLKSISPFFCCLP